MCCCTDVLSRMLCCHVGDDKTTLFIVILLIRFDFILQVFVGAKFSPGDESKREAFKAAGQIKSITLLNSCSPGDFRFLNI